MQMSTSWVHMMSWNIESWTVGVFSWYLWYLVVCQVHASEIRVVVKVLQYVQLKVLQYVQLWTIMYTYLTYLNENYHFRIVCNCNRFHARWKRPKRAFVMLCQCNQPCVFSVKFMVKYKKDDRMYLSFRLWYKQS